MESKEEETHAQLIESAGHIKESQENRKWEEDSTLVSPIRKKVRNT